MSSRNKNKPGAASSLILKLFTNKVSNFEILGDFEEIFNLIEKEKGIKEARKWYRKQLIRSLPSLTKSRITGGDIHVEKSS